MTTQSLPSWSRRLIELAALAVAYYVAGKLGLLLATPPGYATAIWPASGIALAGTLLFGYRIWPGILLGSFLVNISPSLDTTSAVSMGNAIVIALSIGIGASLQAVLGTFLIRRFVENPNAFAKTRSIIKFLLLGGPISCLLNATWSVTSLLWAGFIQPNDYLFHWWAWWVGDSIGVITFAPLVLIWATQSPLVSRRRQIYVSLPLSLAFMLVSAFFIYTNAWEQDRIKLVFERRTDRLTQQLKENCDNYLDILRSLEDLYATSVNISRQDFKIFVSRWFSRYPGIRAISWSRRVPESERANFEEAARADGLSNFQITEHGPKGLVRAGRRAEYVAVYYSESFRGNRKALGLDVAFDPVRREALHQARDTGKPTATDRVTLIQDTEGEPGFVVFLPIYKSGPAQSLAERRLNLQGYVTGAFRFRDIINIVLASAEVKDISMRLYDAGPGENKRPLYEGRSRATKSSGEAAKPEEVSRVALKRTVPFEIAERRWIIEFTPTKEYFVALRRWQSWIALAGGLFFTALLGSFVLAATAHTAKLQATNADLEKEIAERKQAENEATKLAAIVESSEESIIATTWEGIITSWNRGAEAIYGYLAEEVKGLSISILYPPELPNELQRFREKLQRGEHVAQYETIRAKKDGTHVYVSLTLSPLKDATGNITGVASITRDITARKQAEAELQRHRRAVAHRLHDSVAQSLTAMNIHLELAQTLLVENPEAASRHLTKIECVLNEEQQNLRSFVRELKGLSVARCTDNSSAIAVLEELAKRLENQWSVRVRLQVEEGTSRIPKPIVEDLRYIIQEGVSNAVRHGHASTVNVQISPRGEKLVIRIIDNGCGFNFQYDEVTLATNGGGPTMLRSRTASLGGSLNIRSVDSGACLEITLPLSQIGA